MAGVGRRQFSGAELQDSHPNRDEHAGPVVGTQCVVGFVQDLSGGLTQLGTALENDLGYHHEEGRGDPLAGDVRHHQAQVILIDQEEVVEIAAHFLVSPMR